MFFRHEIVDEGSLVIRDVRQSDGGEYTCEVWNLAGCKTTDPVNLYVHSKCFTDFINTMNSAYKDHLPFIVTNFGEIKPKYM